MGKSKTASDTKAARRCVGALVRPTMVTTEMMEFAKPSDGDLWHWANNLSAMLRLGYCRKCGLVTDGCRREGCRANTPITIKQKGQ